VAAVPSRREQIAMTSEEVAAYLGGTHTLVAATIGPRGWPHVVPLWYLARDGDLYAWTFRKSQKVRNLERDPRATLQVESGRTYDQLRGVMIEAETELFSDHERVLEVGLAVYGRYVGDEHGRIPPEVRDGLSGQAPKRIGLRFRPVRTVSWDHRKLGGLL
jgi:nitroimidazol reductase NimA-like FMN-containing flavoprotein (pyridoxamine 5'-phosphate oxidase superfamily)